MRRSNSKRNFLGILVIAMIFSLALPVIALGKDRGRGRGRGFDRFDKKCAKFVNCHDARDGRWDGRGPRRRFDDDRSFHRGRYRDRRYDDDDDDRFSRPGRYRDRRYDDDRFLRNRRNRDRDRDRDFNNDFSNIGGAGLGGLLDLFLRP